MLRKLMGFCLLGFVSLTSSLQGTELNSVPNSPRCNKGSAVTDDLSRFGLKIISLWVSHGDATIIYLPNGEIALVDTGQDFAVKEYLVPFLLQHGIRQLDYFIVTHYHGDHYAGKIEKEGKISVGYRYDDSSPRIPVKQFWDNKSFQSGDQRNFGGTWLTILNSAPGQEQSTDENNRSLSFHIDWNGFTYALGGDIYASEQDRILKNAPDKVRVHVYRTNHHMHGSSSWTYLRNTDPVLFITSAEHAVYQRSAYTETLAGVITDLKWQKTRFLESLLTLEHGNIIVAANSANDWTYGCQPSGQYFPALQR